MGVLSQQVNNFLYTTDLTLYVKRLREKV